MYRTNAQSRLLEEAFLQARLPYRLVGAQRFYGRREVKDMMAYYFNSELYGGSSDLSKAEIWVRNYYTLDYIDGRTALYVIGSDVLVDYVHPSVVSDEIIAHQVLLELIEQDVMSSDDRERLSDAISHARELADLLRGLVELAGAEGAVHPDEITAGSPAAWLDEVATPAEAREMLGLDR